MSIKAARAMECFENTAGLRVKLIDGMKRGDNKRLMCREEIGEGQPVDSDVRGHAHSKFNALMDKDLILD